MSVSEAGNDQTGVLGKVGQEVSPGDLPKQFVGKLTELTGGPGASKLLCGRYGVTAYNFAEPERKTGDRRHVAVLSHGIGANKDDIYTSQFRDGLLVAGYSVLSYSFYGHDWSYAGKEVVPTGAGCNFGGSVPRYEADIFLTQVQEVLDHVLEPSEPIDLWVGHSTGGIVGPLLAAGGIRTIRRFALISPSFWAAKPALAKLADRLHPVSTMLVSKVLLFLVEPEYVKLNMLAYAKKDDGTYFHAGKHEESLARVKEQFKLHPQIAQAVLAVNTGFLRADLLPKHRAIWQSLLQGGDAPPTLLLWGDHDVVVPFEHSSEVVAWSPGRVTLKPLNDLGHDSIVEDPGRVIDEIVSFFAVPGA